LNHEYVIEFVVFDFADDGLFSLVCDVDSQFPGPCILQSPLLRDTTWERLCVSYSLSSHNVVLKASLLSAENTTVSSRLLPLGGSERCIANPAAGQPYRLQLIASGYIASPSQIEWAEIHRILLVGKGVEGTKNF
jgi:hypothetical protein